MDLVEFQVFDNSFCAHKTIQELKLGADIVITSITRNARLLPPRGAVKLEPDDILYILVPLSKQHDLLQYLEQGSAPV